MNKYLDLLPESKKKEIRRARLVRYIIFQELGLLLPVVIFVAMLVAANFILKIQAQGIESIYQEEQKREGHQELRLYEDKFKEINTQATIAAGVQDYHLRWSRVLSNLSALIPDGIRLASLSTKDTKMFLAGKARTREDLLELQEQLKNSACFSNINIPFSNLVSRADVAFQIDLNVNSECLKAGAYVLEKK